MGATVSTTAGLTNRYGGFAADAPCIMTRSSKPAYPSSCFSSTQICQKVADRPFSLDSADRGLRPHTVDQSPHRAVRIRIL